MERQVMQNYQRGMAEVNALKEIAPLTADAAVA